MFFLVVLQNSRRAAKFYKAQDWKSRMSGYIDEFKNHRVQLQEALSLYTASNVKVLVTKMSNLVSQLLATKPDWEKTLARKTQNLGDRSEWLNDDASLQDVVSAADDPVLGGIATRKVSNDIFDIQSVNLAELRGQLKLSLDEVCGKNMKIFELKLAFHTQQLQDAIARSAHFVVRTLSGPHDRLLHEVCRFAASCVYRSRTVLYQDLRELWKEMVCGTKLKV
jgi:hypothetical protein